MLFVECQTGKDSSKRFQTFFPFMQITIDNCVTVEQIAKDLLLEDLLQNIGDIQNVFGKTVL